MRLPSRPSYPDPHEVGPPPGGSFGPSGPTITPRRVAAAVAVLAVLVLAWLLRGVLAPLFFAFLLAYALDPFVDRLEKLKVPRAIGAIIVVVGLFGLLALALVYAIPLFIDELRAAAADLPAQIEGLERRVEPWLFTTFHLKLPHSLGEVGHALAEKIQAEGSSVPGTLALAAFGTLSYVGVVLSALVVPVFALYLLIDFDRIVNAAGHLVPRRWERPVSSVGRQIHRTLGGYVRGQLTANVLLAALYAGGLRFLPDIRLAVPIGIFTGMMAFVPYVGFFSGLFMALSMAILDWHGIGTVVEVVAVMGGVQVLDASFITPRIVGRSVGLAPLEVLLTMMAAASLFGFFGVLLAVPIGAVVKILIQRAARVYLGSEFYRRKEHRA